MALIFSVYGEQYTGPLGPRDPEDSRVLGVAVLKMLCERVRGRQKKGMNGDGRTLGLLRVANTIYRGCMVALYT